MEETTRCSHNDRWNAAIGKIALPYFAYISCSRQYLLPNRHAHSRIWFARMRAKTDTNALTVPLQFTWHSPTFSLWRARTSSLLFACGLSGIIQNHL